MKKMITLCLIAVFALSFCACSKVSPDPTPIPTSTLEPIPADQSPEAESDDLSDLAALGDVEVDSGLFNVTLTVPAGFVGTERTQADYDTLAAENGYKSVTLNADGSVTYVMTKTQHQEMLTMLKGEFQKGMDEMCGSSDYPHFVSITPNDDYSVITVVCSSSELDMSEGFATLALYMYGGMYSVFAGTNTDNIRVDFVDQSGNVFSSANSSEMGGQS